MNAADPALARPATTAVRLAPRRTPLQLALQPIANEVRSLGATGTVRQLHVLRDLVDRVFEAEIRVREAA
jgi:hypothetical protein